MINDKGNCGSGSDHEDDNAAAAETETEIILIRQSEQPVLLLAAMSGNAAAMRRWGIAATWHERRRKWRDRRRRHSPWLCMVCEEEIERDNLSSDFIAAISARDHAPSLWFIPLCKRCEPDADPSVNVLWLAAWALQPLFPNSRLLPNAGLSDTLTTQGDLQRWEQLLAGRFADSR